jgi:endonuclease/exonuclease/phosphatase family metal-dependent hydrolase
MPALRLLTYNVRSLRDDPAAVAAVIRSARPDVVCVQEAPRFLRWRSTCAALARTSGLFVVTGGRPAGAQLLMARLGVDVVSTRDLLLSRTSGLHQRGLAIAELAVGSARWTVAGMHLGLREDERLRHIGEIAAALSGYDAPLVLAGDVNARPGEAPWAALTERWQDAWAIAGDGGGGHTHPAAAPYERIDGIFVDRAVQVTGATVLDGPQVALASDHRPVLAQLQSG